MRFFFLSCLWSVERNWDVQEIEYYLEHFDIDWIIDMFNIEIKNPDSIKFLDAYKALRIKLGVR